MTHLRHPAGRPTTTTTEDVTVTYRDPLVNTEDPDPRLELLMANHDPADVLTVLLGRPSWHRQAACRGLGPDAFFPERGRSTDAALEVCERCAVEAECREAGSTELYGVWGGLSARGRRLVRSRSAPAA